MIALASLIRLPNPAKIVGQTKRLISMVKEFEETRTLRYENGQKKPLLFSQREYKRRLDALRQHMVSANLSACILTSYHNIAYFSNFVFCGFGRPYALVVTPEQSVTVSSLVDGGQPWRVSHGGNIVYTDWKKDNYYHAINEVLKPEPGIGHVGVEHDYMNLQTYKKLQGALGLESDSLKDISGPTMEMRMVKSEEEAALYRKLSRIADVGGFAVRSAIRDGATEYELSQLGARAMVSEIASSFGDKSELRDSWVWLQSGPENTDGGHNSSTNRKLRHGDILSLNCFPMVQGYYTALERTLFVGDCTDDHRKFWEANVAVYRRGCQLLKPGTKCSEVARELNELVASYDMLKYRSFGYGHSFGILCHYYGREAGLELREDVDTVLKPGMIISMEPMLTIPMDMAGSGGYREHDVLIITETGAENITKFPVGPEHNII